MAYGIFLKTRLNATYPTNFLWNQCFAINATMWHCHMLIIFLFISTWVDAGAGPLFCTHILPDAGKNCRDNCQYVLWDFFCPARGMPTSGYTFCAGQLPVCWEENFVWRAEPDTGAGANPDFNLMTLINLVFAHQYQSRLALGTVQNRCEAIRGGKIFSQNYWRLSSAGGIW